jgi:hypothetical protein
LHWLEQTTEFMGRSSHYCPVAVTPQLTKNVVLELGGKVGKLAPVGVSRLAGVLGHVAGFGEPAGVQLTTAQLFKPAPGISRTTALSAELGPELTKVTV